MNSKAFVFFVLLASCASQSTRKPFPPGKRGGPTSPSTKTESESSAESRSDTHEIEDGEKAEPISVGVWIDGAGVESFTALGFLQGLEKSHKVKISKVVGTGLGCWIALSWSLERSTNRAEWQATKLSSWDAMGRSGTLLSRLSTGRPDFSKFKNEISRLLPVQEFRGLSQESDCPVLNARTGALESSRSLGIYKSLWIQLTTPLLGYEEELESAATVSGVLGLRPKLRELDEFSTLESGHQEVQAWIVLSLNSMSILTDKRDPIRDTLLKRFMDGSQGGAVTPEGRPVLVSMPALDLNMKVSRDFAQRRSFLLQGRKYAERFLSQPWIDRVVSGQASAEAGSPQ
jgi:hypothetical protein